MNAIATECNKSSRHEQFFMSLRYTKNAPLEASEKKPRISGLKSPKEKKNHRQICPESFPRVFRRFLRRLSFVNVGNDQKVECGISTTRWSLPIVHVMVRRTSRDPSTFVKFLGGLAPPYGGNKNVHHPCARPKEVREIDASFA